MENTNTLASWFDAPADQPIETREAELAAAFAAADANYAEHVRKSEWAKVADVR